MVESWRLVYVLVVMTLLVSCLEIELRPRSQVAANQKDSDRLQRTTYLGAKGQFEH